MDKADVSRAYKLDLVAALGQHVPNTMAVCAAVLSNDQLRAVHGQRALKTMSAWACIDSRPCGLGASARDFPELLTYVLRVVSGDDVGLVAPAADTLCSILEVDESMCVCPCPCPCPCP